jgi:glucose-6-phosphate 1-dehydrogenase
VEEEGVDPTRETETFAQVTLMIDNWRWAGVPFVLRTGKALGKDRFEAAIHLGPVPYLPFGHEPPSNVLTLRFVPDRVALTVSVNGPSDPFELEAVDLAAELASQDLPPYGRLILDIMEGRPTFSVRADEAEEAWRIVEPILVIWTRGLVPLLEYPTGSGAPNESPS